GLQGGNPGKKGKNLLLSQGKRKTLDSKINLKVQPGAILRIETPGGGGYGPKK
ncbi:hydantoinase B/oxoprolinase family protein, partial [bacterium]|nr:hydantoinase B/oxoprolinase family protein [bacterium]